MVKTRARVRGDFGELFSARGGSGIGDGRCPSSPMTEKRVLVPGPDHPITVVPAGTTVTVSLGGRTIAKTDRALVLQEASYLPLADGDTVIADAVWTYVTPYDAVSEIAGHAAFYPQHVAISVA